MTVSDQPDFDPSTIDRPDPSLFRYYVFVSLMTGPLTPFVLLPLYLRYTTLRYRFDEAGVSMRWGVFFRKEVNLTYRRIQDIHLTRNLLQRWMGLAKISLQTASGSNQAEMAIEGILQPELLRDFLYSRMRGARGLSPKGPSTTGPSTTGQTSATTEQTSWQTVLPPAGSRPGLAPVNQPEGTISSSQERATAALIGIKQALEKLIEQSRGSERDNDRSGTGSLGTGSLGTGSFGTGGDADDHSR